MRGQGLPQDSVGKGTTMKNIKYSEEELREIIFEDLRLEDPINFENYSEETISQKVEEVLSDMKDQV
jgi:hypothetical protein